MPKLWPLLLLALMLNANWAGAANPAKSVSAAIEGLKSPSPKEVLSSIEILASHGSKKAVEPLIALLKAGPRSEVVDAALQCLGTLGDERAVDVLIGYLNHRRADARLTAIFALEVFGVPKVTRAIEDMLRDSDKQVRATAALSLGKIGDEKSVVLLFQAFQRGVWDAAISIGQLGTPKDAIRLSQYLGSVDVAVLLPGFDEFLRRPKFSEKAKLDILDQLFELAGPEVRRFALAYKASFPPNTEESENALYRKVSRMVREIQGD